MPFFHFLEANPLNFIFLLLVGLLLACELGLRIGKVRRKHIGEGNDEGATLVVGSVLGLLAFVLALNLSAASSRQETRTQAGLAEVNAIGTALLQAQAVGGAQAAGISRDLQEYLVLRYRFVRAAPDSTDIAEANAGTDRLQAKIWAQLTEHMAQDKSDAATSLMNALNAAFDASTNLRLAMEYRMPLQIILLLLVMSLLGGGTVGYQFGLTGRKGRMAAIVLSVLWCAIVTAIIDIGSGRIWTFRTDSRAYEWSMNALQIPLPEIAR